MKRWRNLRVAQLKSKNDMRDVNCFTPRTGVQVLRTELSSFNACSIVRNRRYQLRHCTDRLVLVRGAFAPSINLSASC
jgi:hypothetical protein